MTVVTADTDVKKHKEAARAKRADRAVLPGSRAAADLAASGALDDLFARIDSGPESRHFSVSPRVASPLTSVGPTLVRRFPGLSRKPPRRADRSQARRWAQREAARPPRQGCRRPWACAPGRPGPSGPLARGIGASPETAHRSARAAPHPSQSGPVSVSPRPCTGR